MGSVSADGNNHISAFSYDFRGNTTNDGTITYTYDAESQIKTAAGVTYSYDGRGSGFVLTNPELRMGRRVSKSNGKLYWYGSGGEILAETDASGNTLNEYIFFGGKRIAILPSGGSAEYYVEDLLGSSRLMTTNNGTVCSDADFDPYGGEHAYTNTCSQNYKFEGKERDTETGNDDFGARYYTSRFGRWLSADASDENESIPYADLTNPQTLNLYSMVVNDPESFADLDGHVQNASQGLTYPGEGGPSCASMGEGASSAPFTSGCGNDVFANESDAHRFEPLTWHFEPIDPNNLAKGRKLVPDDGDRACDGGSGRCYQWDAKTGRWVPLSLDESKIIIVSRRTVRLANGPMNVLIVVAAAEAAGITAVEAAPAVSAGAKAARANLKFDGPSPGFAYGNGRAFGIRWGKFGLIRMDLHPMSPGAKSQWHIHLFSVGGEEGLRFPISS